MPGRSIVLIGFMGAGKTSVGRALADVSDLELVDTDTLVEARAGRPIAQIFADEGEEAFRALETEAVREAASAPDRVIACGGGAVLRLVNQRILIGAGDLVYLRASPEALRGRLEGDDGRPLLRDPAAFDRLLAERAPAYEAAADVIVDTDGRTPKEIAHEILDRVRSHA